MLHWPAIWDHLHTEDSCGFQWRDVDAVTPEFPLDLHNTSPEYFRHRVDNHFSSGSTAQPKSFVISRILADFKKKFMR